MKLVVPVDDAHRERFQLQMRPGMRSVVSRQLDACTREIDRRRRNSFFFACNFVHVFTNRQILLIEEGGIQSEYDNEKRRVVDCNGQL